MSDVSPIRRCRQEHTKETSEKMAPGTQGTLLIRRWVLGALSRNENHHLFKKKKEKVKRSSAANQETNFRPKYRYDAGTQINSLSIMLLSVSNC